MRRSELRLLARREMISPVQPKELIEGRPIMAHEQEQSTHGKTTMRQDTYTFKDAIADVRLTGPIAKSRGLLLHPLPGVIGATPPVIIMDFLLEDGMLDIKAGNVAAVSIIVPPFAQVFTERGEAHIKGIETKEIFVNE